MTGQSGAYMISEHSGELHLESSTFYLMDPDVVEYPHLDFTVNGMVATTPGHAAVNCGTLVGTVAVTLQTWQAEPPLRTAGWQDIVEVSLHWPGSTMELWGDAGDADDTIPVELPGSHTLRVRVHGQHRDNGEDRGTGQAIETYLIQLWPTPSPQPQTVITSTSETSAYWRTRTS